eukprot:Rmarinus@m.4161
MRGSLRSVPPSLRLWKTALALCAVKTWRRPRCFRANTCSTHTVCARGSNTDRRALRALRAWTGRPALVRSRLAGQLRVLLLVPPLPLPLVSLVSLVSPAFRMLLVSPVLRLVRAEQRRLVQLLVPPWAV